MAVPSSLVIFLSCINATLYNFWARIKIVVVVRISFFPSMPVLLTE